MPEKMIHSECLMLAPCYMLCIYPFWVCHLLDVTVSSNPGGGQLGEPLAVALMESCGCLLTLWKSSRLISLKWHKDLGLNLFLDLDLDLTSLNGTSFCWLCSVMYFSLWVSKLRYELILSFKKSRHGTLKTHWVTRTRHTVLLSNWALKMKGSIQFNPYCSCSCTVGKEA